MIVFLYAAKLLLNGVNSQEALRFRPVFCDLLLSMMVGMSGGEAIESTCCSQLGKYTPSISFTPRLSILKERFLSLPPM